MTARRLFLVLLFAALSVLPMSPAQACSCVDPKEDGTFELTGTVFYGDVLRRDVDGQRATYVVAVKRVYAGQTGPIAEVRAHVSGATCGLELPSSGPAVFFARTEEDGHLHGNLCDGSRTAEDGPPTKLGAGYPPTAPTASATAPPPAASPAGAGARVLPVAAAATFAMLAAAAVVVVPRRRKP